MARKSMPDPQQPEPSTVEEEIRNRKESDWNKISRKADQRIVSHDAAGYESEMTDFSEYDDGYGSNVAHGDLSAQHLTQRDREGVLSHPGYARPLDTEPWQSKAQSRAMHARAGKPGGMSKSQVSEYDKKTDFSKLPEKK